MSLNVAIYGAGELARPYLDALARRAEVQLVGVCDLDRRAAEHVAAGWNAQVFLSYEALLEHAQPQVLWVCVPSHLQGDVLLRAAALRIPFFVAPPGAMDYERALLHDKAIREAKLISAVGFPAAGTDVAREAREYLGSNVVPLVRGCWLQPPRASERTGALDLLWNEASILIDALRYSCGDVCRVHAFAAGSTTTIEAAAGLIVHLQFARGTVGVVTVATYARSEPRVELEMCGEGWTLTFGDGLKQLRVAEADKTTILHRLNNPASEQVAQFLDAVNANDPARVTTSYADALATLAVCHAAMRSAREGGPVDVAGPS